ncbi:DUF3368 domain-containing protein [Dapis sp. BLCC M229]|uniref:DUF3368 domain-containing protein n=1 Tax=Dapis sp. BLCC M229 TaxID=3400188 RepID=UPI003CE7EB45
MRVVLDVNVMLKAVRLDIIESITSSNLIKNMNTTIPIQLPTKEINIIPEIAAWDLGMGESEVLSLALNTPNFAVIIDDRAARRCARTFGIATIGTGGILILAKQRGIIPLVSPRIESLLDAGLWLSDNLINLLKQKAGE